MNFSMKNNFPRIYVSPEVRRKMIELAREFRKTPTKDEKILWQALRGKKLDGTKFRRQQPIGFFVVDFYSSMYRPVVEVDGPIHESRKEADNARQEILEELGFAVLRIKSEDVEKNLPTVLGLIRQSIRGQAQRIKIPSPNLGDGQGGG
jgi:very-short-patch-repair endonuclease